MKHFKTYSREEIEPLLSKREGAQAWAGNFDFLSPDESMETALRRSTSGYVLFGICEDIGVRGNYGKPGTRNAWDATLSALVNIQENAFNRGNRVLLAGFFHFESLDPEWENSGKVSPAGFGDAVAIIDAQVSALVEKIVRAGKVPIAIGGGHNNALGMIRGTSKALESPVNAINIDAHADLRPADYRHSGNGFTYGFEQGYLQNYFIFGLHENYITRAIADQMEQRSDHVRYVTYEELAVRREKEFWKEAKGALAFVAKKNAPFGLEIDCDVMENIPSSALTPSGFTLEEVRQLSFLFSRSEQIKWLHICEAAPQPSDKAQMSATGKLIAYLITDFVR